MKIGIVQMRSSNDPFENLLQVDAFVSQARGQGCELVCFPENVFYRGPREHATFHRRESHLRRDAASRLAPHSEFSRALADFIKAWPIAVCLGSVLEEDTVASLPFNSQWWVQPGGELIAYRKIHLFGFQNATVQYQEAAEVSAGEDPVAVTLRDWRLGLSICYDLRFPELYRHLSLQEKAEILLVPAAFTRETGRVHWMPLLQARAIENLAYVLAPAQWGAHQNHRGQELFCYGHALALDPWGQVLAEAPEEGDALLVVTLEKENLLRFRTQLPALQSTKLFQSTSETSSRS